MFYHFPNRISHKKNTIFGIDRECSGKCLNYIIYNWDFKMKEVIRWLSKLGLRTGELNMRQTFKSETIILVCSDLDVR